MRKVGGLIGTLAVAALLSGGIFAATTYGAMPRLEIRETDPASPAVLGKWENLSLHVACQSDAPVRLRGRTYLGATEILGPQSGMPPCGPGAADALLWFSHIDAAHIDRVTVEARGEGDAPTGAQVDLAVDVQWTGLPPSRQRPAPAWLTQLRVAEKARQDAAYKAYMSRSAPAWTNLIVIACVLGVPAYFILQIGALTLLRGSWRLAAALPLLPMAAVLAHTARAFSRGSNLAALVLIFSGLPASLFLAAVIALGRKQSKS